MATQYVRAGQRLLGNMCMADISKYLKLAAAGHVCGAKRAGHIVIRLSDISKYLEGDTFFF